jgi:hypothetical protein
MDMKNFKPTLLLFLFLGILGVSSCKKSSTKPQTAASSVSVKFNGTAYTATNITASYSKSQNALQIVAINGNVTTYLVVTNVKVGSFDLSTGGAAVTFSIGTDAYTATSGTLVITAFTSTTVTGTFQFVGTDLSSKTGTGTDGTFNTGYTTQ